MIENIKQILKSQREFFQTDKTKNVEFRIEQLKKLKRLLQENEEALYKAIKLDFGKSSFETYISELALIYKEIDYFVKNIKKLSKKRKVSSSILNFSSKNYIIPEPFGVNLIIGAWNYPYQLSFLPAVTALAAGNTVLLKPSELPSNTSKIINKNFCENYFHSVEGGVEVISEILKEPFDKIFFTGSTAVGKIVYEAAAKHLTPVTLELGGKSPTFVLKDCDLKITARRLVWAKFLNAGQTCIAPDYVLVEKEIENQFIEALKQELKAYPSQFNPKLRKLCSNYKSQKF